LYPHDGALVDWTSKKSVERLGLACVVRHKKGHIALAVLHRRSNDPKPTTLTDYLGTR